MKKQLPALSEPSASFLFFLLLSCCGGGQRAEKSSDPLAQKTSAIELKQLFFLSHSLTQSHTPQCLLAWTERPGGEKKEEKNGGGRIKSEEKTEGERTNESACQPDCQARQERRLLVRIVQAAWIVVLARRQADWVGVQDEQRRLSCSSRCWRRRSRRGEREGRRKERLKSGRARPGARSSKDREKALAAGVQREQEGREEGRRKERAINCGLA